MKALNWFDKILFALNILLALGLLFAYVLPYIPPSVFALLSVLTLGVPFLIICNLIFLLFWLFRLKKQLWLSLVVLVVGLNHVTSIYEISSSEALQDGSEGLKVLSYNVRQFNQYKWAEDPDIPQKIADFVKKRGPGVMAMQEYYSGEEVIARSFPHKFIELKEQNAEFGLAIFSRYPIVERGSLDFPTASNNNAIYADIVLHGDTIRFVNVHLQSFGIKPDIGDLAKQEAKKVFLGMGQTFVKQERQMEIVLDLVRKSPHPVVILGDFNNTAYSYIYREIKSEGFFDTFKEAGNGFGRTFFYKFFPLRIDFILSQDQFEALKFETFEVPYSDHYPVMALLRLKS